MIAREWQWAIWDPVARHGDGEGHIRTGCSGGCRMVDGWLCSVNAGGSAVHIIIQNVTTYFVFVLRDAARRGAFAFNNNEKAVKARSRARDTHSPDTSEHSDLIRNRIRISRWPVRRSGGSNPRKLALETREAETGVCACYSRGEQNAGKIRKRIDGRTRSRCVHCVSTMLHGLDKVTQFKIRWGDTCTGSDEEHF